MIFDDFICSLYAFCFKVSGALYYQIAKYYYTPGWHEAGTTLELFFNKTQFEKLDKELQAIMRTAALRLNMWTLCEFEAKNSLYLEKIKNETAVDIRPYPKDVLEALRRYNEDAILDEIGDDAFSKEVYASYDAFRKRASNWSKLTEKAFYNDLQI